MMFTTNSVFIDSSVLVEAMKGNQLDFYRKIIEDRNNLCFINDIVLSEYLFYLISINGTAAPKSLHREGKIPAIILKHLNTAKNLSAFNYLSNNFNITETVPDLMMEHNLLPNDAIILATCIFHNISGIATLDMDFKSACEARNISFIHPQFI